MHNIANAVMFDFMRNSETRWLIDFYNSGAYIIFWEAASPAKNWNIAIRWDDGYLLPGGKTWLICGPKEAKTI